MVNCQTFHARFLFAETLKHCNNLERGQFAILPQGQGNILDIFFYDFQAVEKNGMHAVVRIVLHAHRGYFAGTKGTTGPQKSSQGKMHMS